ncbi:class I SAM-dependent methyltransferase [Sinorhizobium meliloti]|uniref:class I SAM-dependent methyltransferase n=1 Tax=Rhizobium meliloti TaxID=382 RepID=UPI003D648C8A
MRFGSSYPSKHPKFCLALILYCVDCGSGYVPDAEAFIGDYYREEYGNDDRYGRHADPRDYFESAGAPSTFVNRAKAHVRSLIAEDATFGRVLDFGAGTGVFLLEVNAESPYAVEPDANCRKYLDYLNVTMLEGDQLPSNSFDVVASSHAFEHLSSSALIKQLRHFISALRFDGVGLIEVPNGSLSYVLKPNYQEPHTLFFTAEGLGRAISRSGGEVVKFFERVPEHMPVRENAIYRPRSMHSRFTGRGEGLVFIFRRSL